MYVTLRVYISGVEKKRDSTVSCYSTDRRPRRATSGKKLDSYSVLVYFSRSDSSSVYLKCRKSHGAVFITQCVSGSSHASHRGNGPDYPA